MLQASTLHFLSRLKKNNNKPWFDGHKDDYLKAKEDFDQFVQEIIRRFGEVEPDIGALQVKDCVFRIYRDVRFSKNKTPYKTHFAAGFNRGGKRVHYPGYYIHAQPEGLSYAGGGIWRPDANELKQVRQEIDYNYDEFVSIVQSKGFKRRFGELETEDKLIRAPQSYTEENPAIEYLKMKSFTTGIAIPDKDLISKNAVKKVVEHFTELRPFIDFLSRAIE